MTLICTSCNFSKQDHDLAGTVNWLCNYLQSTVMLINQIIFFKKQEKFKKHILNDGVSGGPVWPGN